MGLFSKLFGNDTEAETATTAFALTAVEGPVDELVKALDALVGAMRDESSMLHNPGWQGRMKDLRGSSSSLALLTAKGSFNKDDLFEILTTVRPLYRGTPAPNLVHLDPLNQRVIDAIESVHAASRMPA